MSDFATLIGRPEWMDDAACRGTDTNVFFPERGASTSDIKAVCRTCDVQAECLAYAINMGERFGIWGGLSERERRNIRKGRAFGSLKQYAPLKASS